MNNEPSEQKQEGGWRRLPRVMASSPFVRNSHESLKFYNKICENERPTSRTSRITNVDTLLYRVLQSLSRL